ncbi:MAG: tRNA(Ile)-lysidine synthase [Firmicutes bacterium ADurb.Bin248]|nr:MAG: tRNA(Ile)-lysidine synthase [Firmicutes bacterium ADurb.Bin248]
MKEKIAAFIRENGLIPAGSGVVAGVSGGADSVALLRALTLLAPGMGFSVFAAHLNHGIRGEEADADEAFVADLCESWGVPLIREKLDIPALARAHSRTLEQEGREARYAFFERAKARFGADLVAVAHHKDDQAESVLLHLTRGSGLAGLAGMRPRRGSLIRPMLCVRRAEIEAYLEAEGIPYRTDATNLVPAGTRNRLRLDVIPYIEAHINPAFTEMLCSGAELLRRDEDYLADAAREALAQALREGGYDRAQLLALPPPIRTRAVRLALAAIGADVDVERTHVEKACELLAAKTGARLDLPGARVRTSYGLVFFGKPGKPAPREFESKLAIPGDTAAPEGVFRAEITPDTAVTADPYVACFDLDRLPPDVVARRRRAGDRFFPLGAPGSRKLKECFIDRKVPREARDAPLLASGSDVLFVPGFRIAESVKVIGETTRVLRVTYISTGKKGGTE